MQEGLRPLGRERGWLTILLVPTIIGLVFGTLGSIIATIILSFMKWDLISPPQFAGLDNYLGLLKDQLFLKSITVTVSFALLYVPGTMILSLLVAVLLNRKLRGTGLFRTVYFLPVVSSAVAVGLVWSWIYAKDARPVELRHYQSGRRARQLAGDAQCPVLGGHRQYLGRDRRRARSFFSPACRRCPMIITKPLRWMAPAAGSAS